jgi:hypothetical protein
VELSKKKCQMESICGGNMEFSQSYLLSVDGGIYFHKVSKFCTKFRLIMRPCIISSKILVSKRDISTSMQTQLVIAQSGIF